MEGWRTAHLLVLGAWAGLVAAELIVEGALRGPHGAPHAARLHFWMDVLVELPLLALVLVTGAVLLAHTPAPSASPTHVKPPPPRPA